MMHYNYKASGKFLITAEYAVLDGVPALAVPLKLGQSLEITPLEVATIHWRSYDYDGSLWYEELFKITEVVNGTATSKSAVGTKLIELLSYALDLNPDFKFSSGLEISTKLDFNRAYGMGTSSTLVSLISQWIGCDAYALQFKCFGGSGYDIACATAHNPIIYVYDKKHPKVHDLALQPLIAGELFFVYLNKKQDSRDSIAQYQSDKLTSKIRQRLTEIGEQLFTIENLEQWDKSVVEHEQLISSLTNLTPVKEKLFSDYPYSIKSLGGWGGDFILCRGAINDENYFTARGYAHIYRWNELVK